MTESDGQAFGARDRGPGLPKSDRQDEAVGTVADEVLKLLDAAHTWTLERGRDDAAPPCRYCPICTAVTFVRSTSPEVMEHLEAAGLSVLAALRTMSDQRASPRERARPAATVDKIDLSEDPAWD
jgi:hypothetical protein